MGQAVGVSDWGDWGDDQGGGGGSAPPPGGWDAPPQQPGRQNYPPRRSTGQDPYGQQRRRQGQGQGPYGQDQYGQPPPRRDPYGRDPYGQPQQPYGEQPYGQPQQPYGQQPYGQDQYGQDQYQDPYNQDPYGRQQQYGDPGWGPPPTQRASKGPLIAVLVVVALVVAGIAGAVFVAMGGGDDDSAQTVTTRASGDIGGGVDPNAGAGDGGTTLDPSTGGESVDVFTIREGDCLNNPPEGDTVSQATVVACEAPHDVEAYAVFDIQYDDFPGEDALLTDVDGGCASRFTEFIGIEYPASTLSTFYFYPTAESWDQGDREVTCMVGDPAGQTTGTLRGAAR
jgi:hypothetical protein